MVKLVLTELNDQLDLEAVIGSDLLKHGVSVIELMDQFTTRSKIEYLKEAMKGESVQQAIREWKPRGGNITKALINATNIQYEKDLKELAKKKHQLDKVIKEFEKQKDKEKQQLAWEDVTAQFSMYHISTRNSKDPQRSLLTSNTPKKILVRFLRRLTLQ